ncbi:type III secretion system cytoplasmic ring protein SctQ [Chenggangzhangella methanolivorans]|uniref:Type III secretion system cytoplasmic ring protein SctQ n=1 Tax=Chenggangzhangella methanolivorans TaxID=1437009 RepID=A0A9E6RCY3_9HYPH|nr:type III secretion system cytoplasmic ring protein SctQ [Chenggangzhangella methanolivorans]QZN98461.1 type III secretion system cytoplasmic ring protein SctQ [Chenggangzhangella methanolivorans]
MTIPISATAPAGDWLPHVAASDLAGLNAIHRRRGPIRITFRGAPASLLVVPFDAAAQFDGPAFRVTIGGAHGLARAPQTLLDDLLAPLGLLRPPAELAPEAAALLIEFALADEVAQVEAAAGGPSSIDARVDGAIGPDAHRVSLLFKTQGKAHRIALWLDRDGLARLGAALDRAAAPAADVAAGIAMPVRVCMGWAGVKFSDLKGLSRGDVILVESGREMAGPIAVVADHLAMRLTASSGRLAAAAVPVKLRGSHWEWCMEGNDGDGARATVADAEIDALPVKLVFELGRSEMPLGDVRRLAAGSVVPLARALDEAVDIMANGKRIGRGSIVRIGDAVGVRVERLTADE